jgi:putative ABC transport system permease protein
MAVGIGCFFILAVRALQSNLLTEFEIQLGGNSPDFVLIDVQRDQVDGLRDLVSAYATAPPQFLPVVRARVSAVEGRRVQLPTIEAVRRHGHITREYTLTYRDALQDNERLVDGAFWSGPLTTARTADGADTEVSIEREVHDEAQVDIGDLMQFSVAGHAISARVTSIREVTWDQTQNGGFIFVLRPGPAVDRVPQSFIGFLEATDDPAAVGKMQRGIVDGFPNVSAIDVRAVIESIREVVDNATLAITIVGAVVLASGVLILVGAVAMTKFQRIYETAIYRTLGASTRLLTTMAAVEYGTLGLLAGMLGAAGALGMSYVLATELFDITWRPAPGVLSGGVALTAAIVTVVGLVASVDVLFKGTMGALRRE